MPTFSNQNRTTMKRRQRALRTHGELYSGLKQKAAKIYRVPLDAAEARRRTTQYLLARQYVAINLRAAGLSYPDIGALIKRHHTSVMNLLGARI